MVKKIKHFLMYKSRLKKYNSFISFSDLSKNDTILDIGPANIEYSPYDNFLEKQYPYGMNITALTVFDEPEIFKFKYPEVKVYTYIPSIFPFEDNKFTVSYSNAVIEHVGSHDAQVLFVKEAYRVSKKLFFTTPAMEFPIEAHTNYPFVHYLNKKMCDDLLVLFGKSWATGNYMNLLSKKRLKKVLKDAGIHKYELITYYLGFLPCQYAVFAWK